MESFAGAFWSACSSQGVGRTRNADAFSVGTADGTHFFAVADGIGSQVGSPTASRAAVGAVELWLREHGGQTKVFGEVVNGAVGAALQPGPGEGGTTLACAILRDNSCDLVVVGDSEILAVEVEGEATLLHTLDHLADRPNVLLAWLDGRTHFEPQIARLEILPRWLCLITDGVTSVLDYERIAHEVRSSDIAAAALHLVTAAKEAGASDDITAIVVEPTQIQVAPGKSPGLS